MAQVALAVKLRNTCIRRPLRVGSDAVMPSLDHWKKTRYQNISERNGKFKVSKVGGDYIGTADNIPDARRLLKKHRQPIVEVKAHREDVDVYLEKLRAHMMLVKLEELEPGDTTLHNEIRVEHPYLPRSAPCTYMWGIEGKEKPWWQALLSAWGGLPSQEKLTLQQLTSDVHSEFEEAAKIQHKLLETAVNYMGRPSIRVARTWWSQEVNHLVSQHMGWLGKLLGRRILSKLEDGHSNTKAITLGEGQGSYVFQKFTTAHGEKYKSMASMTTMFLTLPAPMDFSSYEQNAGSILKMHKKYHDLWYYRSIGEAERYAVNGCAVALPIGAHVTAEQYRAIFPDAAQHLPNLAKRFNCDKVLTLMRRSGCGKEDPAKFSLQLCFAGYLHDLSLDEMRKVKKCHLKKASKQHANGHYKGHPHQIWRTACQMTK